MIYIQCLSMLVVIVNVVVVETGRRGACCIGMGFSPWYPLFFIAMGIILWVFKVMLFWRRWLSLLVDFGANTLMLYYNINAILSVLYAA